ncbi:MAG: flagellar basal body P-ring formation protein FlgA [Methylococcaceae bacterium]|nr:flagellar basal body P-ring formation protein FlgA [Methylococcaceae bacterium]
MVAEAAEPDPYEAHSTIQNAVIQFIESNLRHIYSRFEIDFQAMDQRLKLDRCQSPLELFFPPGQREIGPVTIGVRCRETKPWLIYVRARIKAFGSAVVTRRPLGNGTLITTEDIGLKEVELTRMHQPFFDDPDRVLGKELRWSLAAGSILTANQLLIPKAVKKGQQVIIQAIDSGLQIRMKGAALSDGITGQKIAVKNLSSNRIVEGTVTSPGIVQVQF